jgi:hypothetical protein
VLLAAVVLLAAPATMQAASATSATATSSRVVSGPSPYGACADGQQRGAEASPAVAVGARDNDLVVAWQQDPTHLAGGAVTTEAAGLLSTSGPFGGGSCSTGGRSGERAESPSLSRGADGTLWAASVANADERSSVIVSRRAPDASWTSTPIATMERSGLPIPYFPATIAADPDDAARLHVAYVRNHFPAGTVAVHRSSSDSGRTWSDEHVIGLGPTPLAYDFAEQLVALGGNALLAVSTEVDQAHLATLASDYVGGPDLTQAPIVLRARRSTDGGSTWSLPVDVLRLANGGVRDRERDGTALRSLVRPSVVRAADGTVHVAAESVAADGRRTELLLGSSRDGGASWSRSVAATVQGIALAAAVASDGTGRLALSWLDLSLDRPGDGPLTAAWRIATTGEPGGWSAPAALSEPFDLRPLAPSYVGDQGALVGLRRGFAAATVVGTGQQDPSDVVLSVLRP